MFDVDDVEGDGKGEKGGEKTSLASRCVFDEDAMRVVDPNGKAWRIFDALFVRIEIEELPARRSRLAIREVE